MKLLIISVLVAVATCKVIRTKSCLTGSEKVNALKIHKVHLVPCNSNPCILKRGGSTELQIDFTATQDEPDFIDVCHGKVGFWVPFPLSKDHACREQGVPHQGRRIQDIQVWYPDCFCVPSAPCSSEMGA